MYDVNNFFFSYIVYFRCFFILVYRKLLRVVVVGSNVCDMYICFIGEFLQFIGERFIVTFMKIKILFLLVWYFIYLFFALILFDYMIKVRYFEI